ncbi:MAG: tRNA epoxyqueuosine(34) reductase QueG [Robiginitomaculum sp.]|nr:tRNA epoxyqueuosine(34) reductase QueG [Robiginitomaculum sp.]MDQ7078778.1 tRNA epoxyqueuosine(34) reductase QueG [Robiginitomaculum sp.]
MPISISESDIAALRSQARACGFDVCRIADAHTPWNAGDGLQRYVEAGHHGSMAWMQDTLLRRRHPTHMWTEARSAMVLGINYGPAENPLHALQHTSNGVISVYAQGGDYHKLVKKRLKALAGWFAKTYGADVKVFVDTAPLMEKPLAARAGLGWQGKHTNLVSREFGSWLFLGVILTDADLPADAHSEDHCGSCHACLDICPTKAFPAPYKIDARRCISYLTIEHDGPIDNALRPLMGNHIYGCDDCLAVCPWNKYAQTGREALLWPRAENILPDLAALCALDDTAFRELFAGSPIKRSGRDRFIRNVLIAIGNSQDPALIPAAKDRLDDESIQVRDAAVWALKCLLPTDEFHALAVKMRPNEKNEMVQNQWADPAT